MFSITKSELDIDDIKEEYMDDQPFEIKIETHDVKEECEVESLECISDGNNPSETSPNQRLDRLKQTEHIEETFLKMNEISELLKKPFESYCDVDKMKIRELNRPLPDLNLTNELWNNGKVKLRKFDRSMYTKNNWICGCAEKNAFYCFPCVLFGGDVVWSIRGFTDLIRLVSSITKHECSISHINNMFSFSLLGKCDVQSDSNSEYRQYLLDSTEEIEMNRVALTKIINCIRFYGAFELEANGHSQNMATFGDLVDFSAELDVSLGELLDKLPMFKETSKIIQNKLLKCMLEIYRDAIEEEIDQAYYIAVLVDELTDISSQFHLSIILRYIVHGQGQPVERFWNLLKYDGKDVESSILNEIDSIIGDRPNKLIALSFDGAAVERVQQLFSRKYPSAKIVHCYTHRADLLISKVTSIAKSARIFFAEFSGLGSFFSNSLRSRKILEEVVQTRHALKTKWNFQSRGIMSVYENREALIQVMDIIQRANGVDSVIQQATAYKRLLNDDNFIFWLTLFYKIIPHLDNIFNRMQETITDPIAISQVTDNFEVQISRIRSEILLKFAAGRNDSGESRDKRRKLQESDAKNKESIEVCDRIISLTKDRFSFAGHVAASNLFKVEQFEEYSGNFPENFVENTVRYYPFVDDDRLRSELWVLYTRPELRLVSGAVPLLRLILERELHAAFQESTRLLKILITIPMTTSEPDRCFTLSKRIKMFLRHSIAEKRVCALGMLSCEKVFVNKINNFNNRVIDLFAKKKNRWSELEFLKI